MLAAALRRGRTGFRGESSSESEESGEEEGISDFWCSSFESASADAEPAVDIARGGGQDEIAGMGLDVPLEIAHLGSALNSWG